MIGFTPFLTQLFRAFAVVQSMVAGWDSATPETEVTRTGDLIPQPRKRPGIRDRFWPLIARTRQTEPRAEARTGAACVDAGGLARVAAIWTTCCICGRGTGRIETRTPGACVITIMEFGRVCCICAGRTAGRKDFPGADAWIATGAVAANKAKTKAALTFNDCHPGQNPARLCPVRHRQCRAELPWYG